MKRKPAAPPSEPVTMADLEEAAELAGGPLEVEFRNPVKAAGFAMLSHLATLDKRISCTAYRLYALYKMYAQLKGRCWPSWQRLCVGLGVSQATLTRLNDELIAAGYIERMRRTNRTWVTIVIDEDEIPYLQQLARSTNASGFITSDELDSSPMMNADSSPVMNRRITREEEPPEEEPLHTQHSAARARQMFHVKHYLKRR